MWLDAKCRTLSSFVRNSPGQNLDRRDIEIDVHGDGKWLNINEMKCLCPQSELGGMTVSRKWII